ncbi:hypothetical protein HDU76_004802 [Blyttiomyces sp. JEL0837]|nr:hypothetical protein HDU76_004802 [Blyttiomyces sp. JEL0837]
MTTFIKIVTFLSLLMSTVFATCQTDLWQLVSDGNACFPNFLRTDGSIAASQGQLMGLSDTQKNCLCTGSDGKILNDFTAIKQSCVLGLDSTVNGDSILGLSFEIQKVVAKICGRSATFTVIPSPEPTTTKSEDNTMTDTLERNQTTSDDNNKSAMTTMSSSATIDTKSTSATAGNKTAAGMSGSTISTKNVATSLGILFGWVVCVLMVL